MSITVDPDSLARVYGLLNHTERAAPTAIVRALNKGASSTKTAGKKGIREEVRLPDRYVSDRLTVRKASPARQEARLTTPSRGLLLSYFLVQSASQPLSKYNKDTGRMEITRPSNPLLKTRVTPGGTVHAWESGVFLLPLKGSGILAMVERVRSGPGDAGRLDVKYGPSLSQVFNTLKDQLAQPAADVVAAELARQVDLLLSQAPG